jgi:hypothetical protein
MTGGVAGQRRGRFVRAVVFCLFLCLFLGVAAGGVLLGPALAADLSRGTKTLQMTKRKFEQLRNFALFRSRGDKAVLRWGEPPAKTRSKKPPAN